MRTEGSVRPEERVLLVESRAADAALAAFGACLPPRAAGEEVVFLAHGYADVPLGRRYDCCFLADDEGAVTWVTVTVVAVTQQFGRPFDGIPHGWRTLALLRFEPEVPAVVRALPRASVWCEHPVTLLVGDRDAWAARRREYGGFGHVLRRWTEHRRTDAGRLARQAGVPEAWVRGVLCGGPPKDVLLRRLAPVLGLRTPDVFALAGRSSPYDPPPSGARAGAWVPELVRHAVALPPEGLGALRRFAAGLHPVYPEAADAPGEPDHDAADGPGPLLMRLARTRNLGPAATAKTLAVLTGRHWSAATYHALARGGREVTDDLLADFAAVFGVPAADLAVLVGAGPCAAPPPAPAVNGAAELIHDVRALTADQLRRAVSFARSLRERS
ncbi:hypothetical protein ACIRU5_26595 [Streptomyces misionensis]|uniref:hypothetical protein n=1 Tax=Streptomyces misionensis TaxID=67331 RepID=UPI00380864AF